MIRWVGVREKVHGGSRTSIASFSNFLRVFQSIKHELTPRFKRATRITCLVNNHNAFKFLIRNQIFNIFNYLSKANKKQTKMN